MEAFRSYLQQFPNFRPALYDQALRYLSTRQLEAGEYFLSAGSVARSIAFIETGLLRQYYLHKGKEITHCFCREDTITCSYQSLITQEPSAIAIQAIAPCQLKVLSYESLQQLYSQDLFWQQMGRLASEQEYVVTEKHNRFIRDLTATERYLHVLEHDPSLLQRVPLQYLASYLQIAPETLSRIRKKISRT